MIPGYGGRDMSDFSARISAEEMARTFEQSAKRPFKRVALNASHLVIFVVAALTSAVTVYAVLGFEEPVVVSGAAPAAGFEEKMQPPAPKVVTSTTTATVTNPPLATNPARHESPRKPARTLIHVD